VVYGKSSGFLLLISGLLYSIDESNANYDIG